MEDHEFGFTRRKESLLEKISDNTETRDMKSWENIGTKESEENRVSAGAEGTAESWSRATNDDGGSVIPDRSEGVPVRVGGGTSSHRSSQTSSSRSNGVTSPETGSEEANKRSDPRETAVSRQTPNIPNVVEYHLKLKTGQRDSVQTDTTRNLETLKIEPNEPSTDTMRTDCQTPLSSREDRDKLSSRLSKLSIDNNVFEGSTDLPQVFQVKYLGSHDARGLWGIKHTRKPVDNMVAAAKSLPTDTILPLVKLIVSQDGVSLLPLGKRKSDGGINKIHPIESISYGVQDLVYTRVFSMIVVRDNGNFRQISPFECHAFVCESKHHARQLTYALATAFQIYSQNVKAQGKSEVTTEMVKKRFAIDLRSPEEIETDLNLDSEA